MYAVNLADLGDLPAIGPYAAATFLLADYTTAHPPTVRIDHTRLDTSAVVLDGPAAQDEERVTALITLLQTSIGPRKLGRRVRCYRQGPQGGWHEIRPNLKKPVETVDCLLTN